MATYVLPQVLVFQDFQIVPAAVANPLHAHIAGPHAYLLRFSDEDEKPLGQLGFYDHLTDQCFLWPSRPAGAIVDEDYVKLYAENALLQYFEDTTGGGSTITRTAINKVRSDSVNFITNGVYAHDADLLDRGAKVGDVIKVRMVVDGEPVTLWSTIRGFEGDPIAAVIASASADADNQAADSVSATVEQTVGPFNCINATADGSLYDGLADGDVTETYTIVVTGSSVGGDHTTAELRVISASGNDDVSSVTPSANGVPTEIGTRGLTVTFTDLDASACSISASEQDVSSDDLIVGQTFEVVVSMTYVIPTPTSGGTYTGDDDTTYIVEVTRGGKYAATTKPQITVTTTTGVDISGPTTIPAASTAVAVGTNGVTISFAGGTGLCKGDKFYIEVTAEAEGPMRTIVLSNNLEDSTVDGDEASITLFILRPTLEISKNRTHAPPLVNYTTSETEICVESGIEVFDETWTDGGEQVALPLKSEESEEYGLLFVEYRAWQSLLCNEIGSISDVGQLNDLISGPLHPDNPLKWGVFKALENSNGVAVKFTSICDPDDDDEWSNTLELLLGRDDVYGLVPLTRRRTVFDLYQAHVGAQSTPEEGLWRVAWLNLEGVPTIPIVHAGSTVAGHTEATTSDGENALATIIDDDDTSGTQYTIVDVVADNAKFITNGVRAGDILRTLYTGDGFGNFTYTEFVIDAVITENRLRLLAGPDAAVNIESKIEIWRNLTKTEEAAEIARDAGSFGDRRIRAVWPDQIETSGTIQEGYHLCAALAGLASGVLPHQGMTHLEIAGFSDVARTARFNKPQLDAMAVAGTWIVIQDPIDGNIFTRHAVTTGEYEDINAREEMVTRNVDSISFRFKDHFAPFIGVTNVTPSMLEILGLEADSLIEVLKSEARSAQLGGQIIDATIAELRQHSTLKDRVVMVLNVTIPYPLNNLEIHLVV